MTPTELAQTHALCFTTPRPWTADEFETLLASQFVTLIGTPDCFALIRIIADEAELLTIATHPNHRRQGLASGILDRVIRHCEAGQVVSLFLEVAATNKPARALYQSKGFAKTGLRKGYYRLSEQKCIDAELFTKQLK